LGFRGTWKGGSVGSQLAEIGIGLKQEKSTITITDRSFREQIKGGGRLCKKRVRPSLAGHF